MARKKKRSGSKTKNTSPGSQKKTISPPPPTKPKRVHRSTLARRVARQRRREEREERWNADRVKTAIAYTTAKQSQKTTGKGTNPPPRRVRGKGASPLPATSGVVAARRPQQRRDHDDKEFGPTRVASCKERPVRERLATKSGNGRNSKSFVNWCK